jgi:hypothetical protein
MELGHGALPDGVNIYPSVVAAHGDSVLIRRGLHDKEFSMADYFVYNAGDGAANPTRPPSLSLLPTCYMCERMADGSRLQLTMDRKNTAILVRGDGEFMAVAATRYFCNIACGDDSAQKHVEAVLYVLRSSERLWKTVRLQVRHDVNKGEVRSYCLWHLWQTDKVIIAGDRLFFLVDLHQGIVFSDMSRRDPI